MVRVEIGLELAEIRLNTFSIKRPFGQVYWIPILQTCSYIVWHRLGGIVGIVVERVKAYSIRGYP